MQANQPQTLSETLRQAIVASKMPLLSLQQATGVQRASIKRFIRHERSIRLDKADKLAAYFGLALQPIKAKAKQKGR
jgi:plasmid maintenance system antidote protein VapI